MTIKWKLNHSDDSIRWPASEDGTLYTSTRDFRDDDIVYLDDITLQEYQSPLHDQLSRKMTASGRASQTLSSILSASVTMPTNLKYSSRC